MLSMPGLFLPTVFALGMGLCAQANVQLGRKKPQEPSYRLSVLFIPYQGLSQSKKARPKKEAIVQATELRKRLDKGEAFDAMAKEYSADSSALLGGYLGQVKKSQLRPPLAQALEKDKTGRFLGPIETPMGVYLLQRHEIKIPWPDKIGVAHILISFKTAHNPVGRGKRRTRDEARIRAQKVYAELKTGTMDFAKAAAVYSDEKASGEQGGNLGTRSPGDFLATFSDAVVRLKPGSYSAPVETPLGFHIIKRLAIEAAFHASHILIPWKGCLSAPRDTTRSKEEALALAKQILGKIRNQEKFEGLAKKYSSCPSASAGGDLGEFNRGQMVPDFEKALIQAKAGEVVGPVETGFGYHLIWRHR